MRSRRGCLPAELLSEPGRTSGDVRRHRPLPEAGGRFVTVNCNPALEFPSAPSYRKYGFETSVEGMWQEGAPIRWTFYLEDGSFVIENYHLDVAIHEEG